IQLAMWNSEKNGRSMIGADLLVTGDIKCKSDLIIDGRVEGNVSCVSLLVGKTGLITGDISTEDVLVEGPVHGMIKSQRVELKDGCTLEGNISSRTLAIDHGATFAGSVRPAKDPAKITGNPKLKEAAE
ncbi:MAG: polymer-forming cytoskeletal protein, partial [Methyloligellaceae bacterium]